MAERLATVAEEARTMNRSSSHRGGNGGTVEASLDDRSDPRVCPS
jgi:hypothetical protein